MASHREDAKDDRSGHFGDMRTQKHCVFLYDRRTGDKPEIKLHINDISSYKAFNERVKKVSIACHIFMQKTLS